MIYLTSIEFRMTLRPSKFIQVSPGREIAVLRMADNSTLALYLITLHPCCSYLDYGNTTWTNDKPIKDVFFTDEYTLHVVSPCEIEIIQIELIFNHIYLALHDVMEICF